MLNQLNPAIYQAIISNFSLKLAYPKDIVGNYFSCNKHQLSDLDVSALLVEFGGPGS